MTPEPLRGGAPGPARTVRAGLRRVDPTLLDVLLAAAIAAVSLVAAASDLPEVGGTLGATDVAATAVAFAVVVARRRYAVATLALALAALVWSMAADVELFALRAAGLVGLYTVAVTTRRATAWVAGGVSALVLFTASVVLSATPWFDGENVEMVAWVGMATATGDAVRSRRAYLAAVEERAERAEQGAEEEARRRVVEERLRIARELHDVVAHHIAVINVQAGVASHLLDDDPAGARGALDHVRQGGRSVLDELSGILSVLRSPDDPTASTDPLPSLQQLEELVASFDAAGLRVEWRTSGVHRSLPPALGLTGYRLVQESLTNVHKHGAGACAQLRVDYRADALSIEVVNDVGAGRASGVAGHGIVGMRERVAAMGGTLDVGPADGGRFRVHATLPIPAERR